MDEIRLTIDDIDVVAKEGETLLKAASDAAIYIPAICAHPDIPPAPGIKAREVVFRNREAIEGIDYSYEFEGCQLCIVEIDGRERTYTACNTPVSEGMVIHTNTPEIQRLRQENLAKILINHPHICLICAQKEGCSITQCSNDVPEKERCCPKFNNCELRKIAEYIGIRENIPRYIYKNLPIENDEPLIIFDYNLCIGCLRCVRACEDLQNTGALGFVYHDKEVIVGTIAPTLKESNCKFCGACIEVCPTGTLSDKSEEAKSVRTRKLKISPPVLPQMELLKFDIQTIVSVPNTAGVYQLLDQQKKVIYIKGAINMRLELEEQLKTNKKAYYFKWEKEPMYTKRESEIIQQYLQTHGRLPPQNDELADLF